MNTVCILAGHAFKELIRKKDFYVLLILFVGLTAFLYTESFFNVDDITRYLADIGFSLIVLFSMIITVTFSAKQVPAELESKTIYPLLAKPVSRTLFILGKFTGSVLISWVTFTVFFLLYSAIIFSKGGRLNPITLAQAYLFSLFLLWILAAIALCFSLFMTMSANVTVTFLIYFLIRWLNMSIRQITMSSEDKLSNMYGALYAILPHFEFYDMKIRLVHLWDPLPAWVVITVTVYSLVYVSLILWITSYCFGKKSL